MNAKLPSAPVPDRLDPGALQRLRDLDPDGRQGVVVRVLTAFESSLTRLLAQLEAQREGGDAAVVCTVAHTLKSSSASVGALDLAAACAEVESRLRGGASSALGRDVDHLLAQGHAALRAVGAMLRP